MHVCGQDRGRQVRAIPRGSVADGDTESENSFSMFLVALINQCTTAVGSLDSTPQGGSSQGITNSRRVSHGEKSFPHGVSAHKCQIDTDDPPWFPHARHLASFLLRSTVGQMFHRW